MLVITMDLFSREFVAYLTPAFFKDFKSDIARLGKLKYINNIHL
jgi:hypothetical protein